MLLNTSNPARFFLIIFFSVFGGAMQVIACQPAPGNEYEKVYCQLKRSGRGEGLPTIHDFRKNTPLMQALLLKKPAERAGIPLRIPERGNAETVDRQADLLLASAIKPVLQSSIEQKPVTVKAIVSPKVVDSYAQTAASESKLALDPLAGCVLRGFELDCKIGRYRLITNQANQSLSEGALSEENRLNLPVNSGQDRDAYLQQAYGRYLDGMISIGLGASTMSYTKFVHLYDHITAEKLNFAGRFETMYHFLKQDKSSIGVTTKPMIAQGFTTQFCSDVRPELLACEYGSDNHLFLKLQTP